MDLNTYNEKRDFDKTREPKGKKKKSSPKLKFVVQKHDASRLHYDFRIEIDGVLVSWAVPKGPSVNPADKRLAMHTEDHPMDYMTFEGTIPKGEYGGGTMMVWDVGTYEPAELKPGQDANTAMRKQHEKGAIRVALDGKKLKGVYNLQQMKGKENHWLMIKSNDEFAAEKPTYDELSVLTGRDMDDIANDKKPSDQKKIQAFDPGLLAEARKIKTFPDNWSPQKALSVTELPEGDLWHYEKKIDGYRALVEVQNGKARLVSRNGNDFTHKYGAVADAFEGFSADVIFDGEIAMQDAKGEVHFSWLQNPEKAPKTARLVFWAFDFLYFAGFDLRRLPLSVRRQFLEALLPQTKHTQIVEILTDANKALQTAANAQWEGLIAKKTESAYQVGKRNSDWVKFKIEQQQEMVIGGFTEPAGGRKGIGALLCGFYQNGKLRYSGRVGSGFNANQLIDIRKKLEKIEQQKAPFENPPRLKNVHWTKPEFVAQIKFTEITSAQSMRHPVFLGWRDDKKPTDVILEKPAPSTEPKSANQKTTAVKTTAVKTTKSAKKSSETPFAELSQRVKFTNVNKIFWPDKKITKGDVIRYYDAVADYILPHLKDRPQSLRRTPNGILSDGFFQKNVEGVVPKWIKTRKIKSESKSESVTWLLCQDKDTLLYLANMGCIELNPWNSRVGSLNQPDFIVFDLDPKDAPLENIVKTATKLKQVLDFLELPAFVKTSGGNGIHIFVPILPNATYDQVRTVSQLISQMVHRELPDITSLERMPDKRRGKVYLDYLQNGRGKTMASIYALRPRENAGVSTPLEWSEVNDKLDLNAYNLFTISERLGKKGDLWKNIADSAIDLRALRERLSGR